MLNRFCSKAIVLAGLTLLAASCSRDSEPLAPPDTPDAAARARADHTGEFITVQRHSLRLEARGALRPGSPVTIQLSANANRPSSRTSFEILSLDEAPLDPVQAQIGQIRRLTQASRTSTRGSSHKLTAQVTFAEPGYYRIMGRSVSVPEQPPTAAAVDTVVLDNSSETLWLLVDDKGGRLTPGFQPVSSTDSVQPLYGTYGPLRPVGSPGRITASGRLAKATASCGVFGYPPCTYNGFVHYFNQDNGQLVGIPNAFVSSSCWRYQSYPPVAAAGFTGYTDANGRFTHTCPSGYETFKGTAVLSSSYANVLGKDGAFAGAAWHWTGSAASARVVNDFAAHVYVRLNEFVPIANARFGRSRATIVTHVANNDSTYPIHYDPSVDRLRFNQTRIFNEDGTFVIVHEYGHSFHYKAIEPWRSYFCSADGRHSYGTAYTLSCAFVEGFADFFSSWVAGSRLTTSFFSDNRLETNTYRSAGDGSRVEAAVSGFWYDLVDGAGEPDSPSNTSNGDESFDAANYPGSYIAAVMATCTLNGSITRLDGIDEFVYCAERTLSAQSLTQYFPSRTTTYTSFTEGATEPSTWSQSVIRRLWLYNLYNVGP